MPANVAVDAGSVGRLGALAVVCGMSVAAQGPDASPAAVLSQGRALFSQAQVRRGAGGIRPGRPGRRRRGGARPPGGGGSARRCAPRSSPVRGATPSRWWPRRRATPKRWPCTVTRCGRAASSRKRSPRIAPRWTAGGARRLIDARRGLARALASRGQLDDALRSGAARARHPRRTMPELLAVAGSIYERLGRYAEAAAAYDGYASRLRGGRERGDWHGARAGPVPARPSKDASPRS